MATVEIPDEDISLVKSALGRAGALLEWEGKTHKNADKRERLTNEGAALISLAMQLTFFPFEPEDVTGTSEEIGEVQDLVDGEYDTVYNGIHEVVELIPHDVTAAKYIEGGYEEDNDKWDGIRDHDNDH